MSELVIAEVMVDDVDGLSSWYAVCAEAGKHDVGDHAVLWTPTEAAAALRTGGPRQIRIFVGRVGDEAIAAGFLGIPQIDNLDSAEIEVVVAPSHRRQGHGSTLLGHLEDLLRAAGRTRLDSEAGWAYDAPADGSGTAGAEFARTHGYVFGIGDVQRELQLPASEDLLQELIDEAAPHHADYEIRTWAGPVPDDLVVGWLELTTTLMTEAPMGEMQREPEKVDVEAHRQIEERLVAQGRTSWHAVAIDATGQVAAYSHLIETQSDNPFSFQWGTLVARDHRGHRLGQAVKAANHLAMQRGADVAGRRVVTWNAEVNEHMIGINERLGFEPVVRGAEFQKRLDTSA